MSDGGSTLLGLFGPVIHAVHYTLLYGGLVALAGLLLHSRPGAASAGARRSRAPSEHDRRVALLRDAATDGRLAAPSPVPSPVPSPDSAASATLSVRAAAGAPDADQATWLPMAVVSSAAAAGVHAAVGPAHFQEGLLVGGFFIASALAQTGWSLAILVVGPSRGLLRAALAGNAGVIGLWVLSRTTGVPGGPTSAESVGPWDLAATGWELMVVVGVSLVLTSGRFAVPAPPLLDIVRWSATARTWLVVSVTLMLVLTATGTSA